MRRLAAGLAVATLAALVPAPSGAVVGGVPVHKGEYPFVVALVDRHETAFDGQFCGGALVAPQWVLTAAHCVSNKHGKPSKPGSLDVQLGRITLSARGGERVHVSEIKIDPARIDPDTDIDVALLRLEHPVDFPTVALASSADAGLVTPGTTARTLGWGITKAGNDKQLKHAYSSDRLRVAEVPILGAHRCVDTTDADAAGAKAIELCAGNLAVGGVDSCEGDSGGPLLVATIQGWVEVGVTSWSAKGCGLAKDPGVYSSVPAAYDWITQTIDPNT